MRITNLGMNPEIPYKLSNVLYHLERFLDDYCKGDNLIKIKNWTELNGRDYAKTIDFFTPDGIMKAIMEQIFNENEWTATTKTSWVKMSENMDYSKLEAKSIFKFLKDFREDYFNSSEEYVEFFDELLQSNLDDLLIEDDINLDSDDSDIDFLLDSDDIMKYHDVMSTEVKTGGEYVLSIVDLLAGLYSEHNWSEKQLMDCIKWCITGMVQNAVFSEGDPEQPVQFGYNLNETDFQIALTQAYDTESYRNLENLNFDWINIIYSIYDIDSEDDFVIKIQNKLAEIVDNNDGSSIYFWSGFPQKKLSETYNKNANTCIIFKFNEKGSEFEMYEFNKQYDGEVLEWSDSKYTYLEGKFNEYEGYSDERAEMNENMWGITESVKNILDTKKREYQLGLDVKIEDFTITKEDVNEDSDQRINGEFSFYNHDDFITGTFTLLNDEEDDAIEIYLSDSDIQKKYDKYDSFEYELNSFVRDNVDRNLFNQDIILPEDIQLNYQKLGDNDKSRIYGQIAYALGNEHDSPEFIVNFSVSATDELPEFDDNKQSIGKELIDYEMSLEVCEALKPLVMEVIDRDLFEEETHMQISELKPGYLIVDNNGLEVSFNHNGYNPETGKITTYITTEDTSHPFCDYSTDMNIFTLSYEPVTEEGYVEINKYTSFILNTVSQADLEMVFFYEEDNDETHNLENFELIDQQVYNNEYIQAIFNFDYGDDQIDGECTIYKSIDNLQHKIVIDSITEDYKNKEENDMEFRKQLHGFISSNVDDDLFEYENNNETLTSVSIAVSDLQDYRRIIESDSNFPNPLLNITYPFENFETTKIITAKQFTKFIDELYVKDGGMIDTDSLFIVNNYQPKSLSPEYVDFERLMISVMNNIIDNLDSREFDENLSIIYLSFPSKTGNLVLRLSIDAESWNFIDENWK